MKIPTTRDDPSTLYGALVTVIGAVFSALVVFDVLAPDQAAALGAVLTTALPVVLAFAIRRNAWAPDTVELAVEVARRDVEQAHGADWHEGDAETGRTPRPLTPAEAMRGRGALDDLDGGTS